MSYDISKELGKETLSVIRFLVEDHAFSSEFLVTAIQEYYQSNKPKDDQRNARQVG